MYVPQIDASTRVVVLSGAGLSAAAGLDTFRDEHGLWSLRPDLENAMHGERLPGNLADLWHVWAGMFTRACAAGPTAGHTALAALGARIITQNVDGLHQLAGSADVVELHGNGGRAVCLDPECPWSTRIDTSRGPIDGGTASAYGVPERCPVSGAPTRPDVVLFGEQLPPGAMERAVELVRRCDLFISVGTSGTVVPAALLAPLAQSSGAECVSIDPHGGYGGAFDHVVVEDAQVVLPAWAEAAGPRR